MVKWLAGLGMLLPGICWWVWTRRDEQDPVEALAEMIGFSAGVISLGALGFYLLRIPVSEAWLWCGGGLLFALACVGIWRGKKRISIGWSWLAALVLAGLITAWRYWQARDLVLPNWVDSLHHALIVRKMVEAQGLTSTLEPYLPGPFTYHFAFHALSALFSGISGVKAAESVLVMGHLMSAAISLGGYVVTKTITRDWRPALLSALLITFGTRMPGYYVSWGRYTLMTGMMFLPLAIAQSLRVWNGERKPRDLILLAVLTGGTLLSHYLAAILLALFLVIIGLSWLIGCVARRQWKPQPITALTLTVLFGLLLVSPWYVRAIKYAPKFIKTSFELSQLQAGAKSQWDYLLYLLGPQAGLVLLGFALGGAAWGLLKKESRALSVWALLVGLLSLPFNWKFVGFRSDYFALTLFLVVSVLAGLFFFWGAGWLDSRLSRKNIALAIAIVMGLGIIGWGGWQNRDVINNETILADESDVAALDWINEHVPENARFFVNTTSWGYGMYRGVDGGAWILPYTGRWALAPTVFYTFGGDRANSALWSEWSSRASKVSTCGTDFWELADEAGLGYVYVREGRGALQETSLADCDGLSRLYRSNGVSIWLITPESSSLQD